MVLGVSSADLLMYGLLFGDRFERLLGESTSVVILDL